VEDKYNSTRERGGWGGWFSNEVVGCGNTLERDGEFFLDLSDLRWRVGVRSSFGMICSVGTIS
jgi:hypothetical protein